MKKEVEKAECGAGGVCGGGKVQEKRFQVSFVERKF